ncbi:DUF29 domain-containing protein [Roseofilum reptotaenium CS-1145]|uniref:DUF29 domain-containing protein n=1 Tax=Roseofilum reptotaenium AO1-A TaxID=1925591 RepID=A0A1L9QM60_9CYAN|nr:DUF29 domain-containing protein [Roseofilum reptotaenium]MDB9515973.1 DUF29 domain-containing protein [Roseofilum reptotaenium CS-1145]OJJ21912.1 hypothetical protein BI308_20135 [Roseofilum reptotaenium AO1-A]
MNSQVTLNTLSLYDQDYHLWLEQTLIQLRSHNFEGVDLDHLIEELESLGKREKRGISSYLMRLCEHLLKIQYWEAERERCFRGWNTEITNFRIEIAEELESSPSLNVFLEEIFVKQYQNGRKLFLKASELDEGLIPYSPKFTLEQALDENWLPNNE